MPLPTQTFFLNLRAWDKNRNVLVYDQEEIRKSLYFKASGYTYQQWIGHYDDSQTDRKIYVGDICEVEMQNEFGSCSTYTALVGFDPVPAQYVYDIFSAKVVLGGAITKAIVIGNINENPTLLKKAA